MRKSTAGGDMVLEHPSYERLGSHAMLRFKATNRGPRNIASCEVEVRVDGQRQQVTQVGALAANKSKTIEYRYTRSEQAGKPFEARVLCNDLASANNQLSGRLRD